MNDESPPSDDTDLELAVLNKVAENLRRLSDEGQLRVLHMLSVLLKLPMAVNRGAAHESTGATSATTSRTPSSFSEDRSPSAKEFLLEKKPYTDIERIACLAYYLTHYRSTPHFKTLDLSKLNTEAAQIKFSNAAKAVDNAARSGLLAQANKGQKQISASGELYVEALPNREAAKEAISHARPRRKTRTKVGSSDSAADE